MRQRDKPGRPSYRVLSSTAIWVGAIVLTVVAAGSVWLLLATFGSDPKSSFRLEIIKAAVTVVVGTGGATALLLAARRQRFVELDGTERRITDLQTKAADQLGSDKAAVRLAGLYALERLAQDNPSHRQTIVDVMCAYLRMPYTPPPERPAALRSTASLRPRRPAWMRPQPISADATTNDDRRQEHQVRLTAQRILAAHLEPDPRKRGGKPTNPKFWPNIDLDLTGATLLEFDLKHCRLRTGTFTSARFIGHAWFDGAAFTKDAWFDRTAFTADVRFGGVTFTGDAWFDGTTFTKDAWFGEVTFTEEAHFNSTTFTGDAWFGSTAFNRDGWFNKATFISAAWFEGAAFTSAARFNSTTFASTVSFEGATFAEEIRFGRAHARVVFGLASSVWPPGWVLGDAAAMPQDAPSTHEGTWHPLTPSYTKGSPQNPEQL
ncbi:pentapeptide repeat-containing protein [Allokutzneria sp. A3M-2-11 16]|uniref:pentapeptide repeat-containing protein n=1 Tax=Allokutzneria sp. A3M-2-11 16 TaxID=2962043 RepID=UPI0020B68ECC|nr:pentapeptide repeat-containing protein [Allokutzneria sp. A3M-2-11 16]MCP3800561.1 pentapeptide repeat-containing protein [Allokutzneria sp. A3M-2-11 16]